MREIVYRYWKRIEIFFFKEPDANQSFIRDAHIHVCLLITPLCNIFHFLNKTILFNVMQVWTHVFFWSAPKNIFSWQMTSASWQTYKRTQPRYCLHKLYHAERNKVGMNEELFYISMFFARNLSNSCIWLLIS